MGQNLLSEGLYANCYCAISVFRKNLKQSWLGSRRMMLSEEIHSDGNFVEVIAAFSSASARCSGESSEIYKVAKHE